LISRRKDHLTAGWRSAAFPRASLWQPIVSLLQ